jgi:hypothetical protein
MTTFFRTAPTYSEPLVTRGTTKNAKDNTTSSWYRWFQNTEEGVPPQSEITVAVSGSPFTYTAVRGGYVIVYGGTVSGIQVGRTSLYATGLTSGSFALSKGDRIVLTFSSVPTVVFFAQ